MATAIEQADARTRADGFRPGCLNRVEALLDQGEAYALQCRHCGNLGHALRTYVRGRRYRAMAICVGCHATSEF